MDDNQAVENVFAGEAVRKIESFIEQSKNCRQLSKSARFSLPNQVRVNSSNLMPLNNTPPPLKVDGIETRAAKSNKHGAQLGVTSLSHRKGKDESDK